MTNAHSRRVEFEALLRRHGAEPARIRGSRGLVRCVLPGHDDRSASLSLDLEKAIFHCFGCGRGGGLKALREFLGEAPSAPTRRRTLAEAELQQARRAVMQREHEAEAERAEWAPWQCLNAYVRRCKLAVACARALATQLGPDDPRTWSLLEQAAVVEREGLVLEAELDALAMGRLT